MFLVYIIISENITVFLITLYLYIRKHHYEFSISYIAYYIMEHNLVSYMVCMNSLVYIFSLWIYANKSYTILFHYYFWYMININCVMIIM